MSMPELFSVITDQAGRSRQVDRKCCTASGGPMPSSRAALIWLLVTSRYAPVCPARPSTWPQLKFGTSACGLASNSVWYWYVA